MFNVKRYSTLLKRVCKKTSVVDKGDSILLIKDSGLYKTFMKTKNGEKYWPREFYCLEKAVKDFNERVESRLLIEALNN